MHEREKLREDYKRWHPAQIASKDIDPVYPVLRELADVWGLDAEQRAWLVMCHVVWYHPGSTLAAFQRIESLSELPTTADGLKAAGLLDLPTGTERRGHRPKQPLIDHLLGLHVSMPDGVWPWAQAAVLEGEDLTLTGQWLNLNEQLTTIRGNGRWAAYKTAEMFQKVCDLQVEAADAGHRYSSGPRKGLNLLEPDLPTDSSPAAIAILDYWTSFWADELEEDDIALVETSLCDFNSLVHGRYYLGHDIDYMAQAFNKVGALLHGEIIDEAWEARARVFETRFLAEEEVEPRDTKAMNRHYKLTGELLYV